MSLFDSLDTYKTTPKQEIRKINSILDTKVTYYGTRRFVELFTNLFPHSCFAEYEPNYSDFISNHVFILHDPENDSKTSILQYRYFSEFLLNLLNVNTLADFKNCTKGQINQLRRLIDKGMGNCGYKIIKDSKNRIVTSKSDETAEAVASTNPALKECIFEYLIAKTKNEKEIALTVLSNKLEAIKNADAFFKSNKEFVQLLRHKDEIINNPKYSWFFEDAKYEDNLDQLFRLFLSMIVHKDGNTISDEFKKRSGSK